MSLQDRAIKIEIPSESLEPLFNALSLIKPHMVTTLERQAIGLLKQTIYFEIELMLETIEEKEDRAINFKRLFAEQKRKIEMQQKIERELEEKQKAGEFSL